MTTLQARICFGKRWLYAAAMLGVFFLAGPAPGLAAGTYTLAVTPQFENRKLFSIWKPIATELEKRTGLAIKVVASLSLEEFEKEIGKGSFDFVYVNPYLILKEHATQGYIPLVRDRSPVRGILVVRKDSPIRKVEQLNGKKVAFPSPNALGAGLLLRADLDLLYKTRVVSVHAKTHNSSYLHVINGLADAGGGTDKTLQEQDPAIRDALRVLYTTREAPSLPVAAHPRVPKEHRELVRRALLDMAATPEGKQLLAKVPMPQPVVAAEEEYLAMRKWHLDDYWVKEF